MSFNHRADFPVLDQRVRGDQPLVYLDSGATTQKPRCVIDAVSRFYQEDNANVHRGVHALSERSTLAFDAARVTVQRLFGAAHSSEIIFTRGTTESINLVANSWGRSNLKTGDEILLSPMEHHSNIVPWQLIAAQTGAIIKVMPMNMAGEIELKAAIAMMNPRTKLVGVVHASNALGTINPVKALATAAHAVGAIILVDGAQAISHFPVDVVELDVDFYACSAHKMYGPTGIGALYGKKSLLKDMPPWMGGGDMIYTVSYERSSYAAPPARFEAGTPNIAGAIGFAAAIDYVQSIGFDAIMAHEEALLAYGTEVLQSIPGVKLIGTAHKKVGVLSFVVEGVHPHDLGTILDMDGVAIRAGHHCAQPVMVHFGVPATARASLGLYNTREDLDHLKTALLSAIRMFS